MDAATGDIRAVKFTPSREGDSPVRPDLLGQIPRETIHERFSRWRREGLFDRLLDRFRLKLNAEGLIDLDLWCIDSTSVRASRSAAGAGKKGIPRSRSTMRSASREEASAPRSTW